MQQKQLEDQLLTFVGWPVVPVDAEIRDFIKEVARKACHTKTPNKLAFAQRLVNAKIEYADNHFRLKTE